MPAFLRLSLCLPLCLPLASLAQAADGPLTLAPEAPPAGTSGIPLVGASSGERYGFLNLLDHRSVYGKYWFPEPLRTDEGDVDNEVRLDYFHGQRKNHQSDTARMEVEHSFGLLTLEIAGGYASDRTSADDPTTGLTAHDTQAGFTNIELGGRCPILQYVSPDAFLDDTFVLGLEIAPPTHTKISRDTEIVPKLLNLLKVGDHLSIQSSVGLSTLIGAQDRGLATLEYRAVFGYEITHDALPLPLVMNTTLLLELEGDYTINHDEVGHNALFGTAGARFNMDWMKWLGSQPRLGVGTIFPLDQGARQELSWGIITSLIFEY